MDYGTQQQCEKRAIVERMMDLMVPIQNSPDALKFAVKFNTYDLSEEQREALLNRCQQMQEIVEKVKESSRQ